MTDRTELKFFFEDLYLTHSGICSQEDLKARPLATVAMHPAEDYIGNSVYIDLLREYVTRDYGETLGMTFDEFLKLPHWKAELIRKSLPAIIKEKQNLRKAAIDAE